MRTWTASTTIKGRPEAVLDVLTDPQACARWAPMPFEVERIDSPRLRAGTKARVSGCLAGKRVGFDVQVHEAEADRLELTASGPVAFDVAYDLRPGKDSTEVSASVAVSGRGLTGRLLAQATDALLAGGALQHTVSRIAREVETALA